jgi:predicted nuclease with TOPRIM domain
VQIGQLREEVEKNRRENGAIRCQNDAINEKCFKTQSYIRGLLREEANLNEALSKVEDENAKLDSGISELTTAVSINESSVAEQEKDVQELMFLIANK